MVDIHISFSLLKMNLWFLSLCEYRYWSTCFFSLYMKIAWAKWQSTVIDTLSCFCLWLCIMMVCLLVHTYVCFNFVVKNCNLLCLSCWLAILFYATSIGDASFLCTVPQSSCSSCWQKLLFILLWECWNMQNFELQGTLE